MAKQRQVNVCINRDNIPTNILIKSLQQIHIKSVEEIIKSLEWQESQIGDLLTEIQKKLDGGRIVYEGKNRK